jgi:hypothetical protein
MKKLVWIFSIFSLNIFSQADGIMPSQFRIQMAKNCVAVMLSKEAKKESKKIFTAAASGDCVENMGCIRNITQKELDSMDASKRYYAAWKNPVWCKVAYGKKEGWIEEQYLSSEPCKDKDE